MLNASHSFHTLEDSKICIVGVSGGGGSKIKFVSPTCPKQRF